MCVYECTEKPFDGWVETLVKHEVHRYLSTSEWINAANKDTSIELSQPLFEPYLIRKLNNQSKMLKVDFSLFVKYLRF
jgi:hypothetical protein